MKSEPFVRAKLRDAPAKNRVVVVVLPHVFTTCFAYRRYVVGRHRL